MPNTTNELEKKECGDTTKKWERKCPQCDLPIIYTLQSNYCRGRRTNAQCRFCAHDGALIGRVQSDEEKEKRAKKLRGLVRSIESRKRYSLSKTGNKNPHFGKHVSKSKEHRQKIRLGVIRTLKRKFLYAGKFFKPSVNPNACRIIDEYGTRNGYKFQHALNGGEYHITELGYWLDGYDKEKNVAIEYFEPWHSRSHHKKRDERRRLEIIDFLKCSFIILREDTITHGISEHIYRQENEHGAPLG